MDSKSSSIAKNTLFLYFRMAFTMIVSLYTSRVILRTLGVDDFGIYQAVGGFVALLSFINGALSVGTSRFLTYELGTGNVSKLYKTFSTVLISHIVLSLLVVVVAETFGLWFVYNKLVIPTERMDAAIWTYHLSIIASVFSITQVPYNASIISHERMSIYAYASIVETTLKLLIVYIIGISCWDKLITYSILLCTVNIGITLFYRIYCIQRFPETKKSKAFDFEIFRSIIGYSGWNLLANTSLALTNQGSTVLMNIFFNPSIVTARVIANQVNMAANQFINNFRTAANPQIVKNYARGDFDRSKSLLLISTKISYYLMLILALPIFLVADPLLRLWLGQVPPYSVAFLQYAVITSLFQVFDVSFYTALYAKGRIRENALLSPLIDILAFLVTWLAYYHGFSPIVYSMTLLIAYIVQGIFIKPLLVIKIVGYTYKDILNVFKPCFGVTFVSSIIPLYCYYKYAYEIQHSWAFSILICVTTILLVALSSWFYGIKKENRKQIISMVYSKLHK